MEPEQEVIPPAKNKGGRPPHQPSEQTRQRVESMSAVGINQPDIARVIGIHEETLRIHYREELDTAATKANSQVAGMLFKKCMEGDTASIIFWCKTRLGMKETSVAQLQRLDKDGKPMDDGDPFREVTKQLVIELMKKAEDDV